MLVGVAEVNVTPTPGVMQVAKVTIACEPGKMITATRKVHEHLTPGYVKELPGGAKATAG
jgi:hypothetical protein